MTNEDNQGHDDPNQTPPEGHDQTIPYEETDTDAPPPEPSHGWLEQFESLTHSSFEQLKSVVETGIQATERVMLMKVGLKLFALAVHNAKEADFSDDQKSEIESLILELETTLNLNP